MTPELEPVENIFRRVSLKSGRPWPPDRYLGAKARGIFACERVESLFAEALARSAVIAMYQEELRELLTLIDQWTDVAEELACIMGRAAEGSPWPSAMQTDGAQVSRKRWVLDDFGAWWREELDERGVWVRRSEDPQ